MQNARDALSHASPAVEAAALASPRESGGLEDGHQMTPSVPHSASPFTSPARERASTDPENAARHSGVFGEAQAGRGGHVRRRLPISRFGSDPTVRSVRSGSGGQGMSANPATEVEGFLRHLDIDGRGAETESMAYAAGSEQEMDAVQRPEDLDAEKMDSSLPANDGMNALRQQLHEIRMLAISTEEKARRMHALMTQDYVERHLGNVSPMSLGEGESKALSEEPAALDVGLAALPIDPSNPYNLRPGDLEPSFSPLPYIPPQHDDPDESMLDEDEEDPIILGCMHYKRNVKVQCFDCHRWFPCRYCHDQAQDLPFPHSLRRKMTRNMMCMLCQTPQPAAEACMNCGEYAAWYFCPKCKLWDNDSNKRIYHCDDCGICRLGEGLGKDFVHCKKCDVCISIARSAAHTCVENATKGLCPLCLDDMFSSRAKVVSLPCGHYMHAECYRDLMAVTYKCPVCSKSAVNMELQWRKLDDEIRAQPMPDDDDDLDGLLPHLEGDDAPATEEQNNSSNAQPRRPRKVWIGCNDCNNRCWTPFHWLGLKCKHCDSYNTTQMGPTAGHVESNAERLLRQQQVPHQQETLTGAAVLADAGIGHTDSTNNNNNNSPVDSALDIPSSPTFLAVPGSPGSPNSSTSASSMPSPRRYFTRDADSQEPRRPSFTTPRFSTPTLPTLSDLPRLPRMPNLPEFPRDWPNLPNMPEFAARFPDWPNLPNMPEFAARFPEWANLPNMPEFVAGRLGEWPGWGAGGLFDGLSRSLSPMRFVLQGLDMGDAPVGVAGQGGRGRGKERRASRLSVRSDPTADASGEFWGDEGDDAVESGDEEGEEGESSSGSGSEEEDDDDDDDADMDDEGDDGDDDDGEDPMELFGHR